MNSVYQVLINNGWTKYTNSPYSETFPSFEKYESSQRHHMIIPRLIDGKSIWIYDFYDYTNVGMPIHDYTPLTFSSIEKIIRFLNLENKGIANV